MHDACQTSPESHPDLWRWGPKSVIIDGITAPFAGKRHHFSWQSKGQQLTSSGDFFEPTNRDDAGDDDGPNRIQSVTHTKSQPQWAMLNL